MLFDMNGFSAKCNALVKSSGHRKQTIEIYYNAVGIINLPNAKDDECVALHGRAKGKPAG